MGIAVLIDDFFENVEYADPVKAFKGAGHSIVTLGMTKGKVIRGKREKTELKIDEGVENADMEAFDALFIPGGYSPDRLRGEPGSVAFVKKFLESGKPVFAICHAPQLLITADALRGRKVTGWKSIVRDITNAGATFVDEEVVEDGNLISSRGPGDIPAFTKACIERLRKNPR
jgi:protease I